MPSPSARTNADTINMIMKTGLLEIFFILSAGLLTSYTNNLLGLIGATLSIVPIAPIVLLEFRE